MKVKVRYLVGNEEEETAPVVAEFWALSRKHALRKFKRLFLTEDRRFEDMTESGYVMIALRNDDIFWMIYV